MPTSDFRFSARWEYLKIFLVAPVAVTLNSAKNKDAGNKTKDFVLHLYSLNVLPKWNYSIFPKGEKRSRKTRQLLRKNQVVKHFTGR